MIREIDDYEHCYKVIINSFLEVNSILGITEKNCPGNSGYMTYHQFQNELLKGLKLYGFYNPELVACIGLYRKSDVRTKIKMLCVLPRYRHLGIGKELMDFAESKADIKLVLGMIYENQKLFNWYLSLGYEVDKIKTYKGNDYKVAYMEKTIEKNISETNI